MNRKWLLGTLLSAGMIPVFAVDYTNIILVNLDDVGYGDFSCNGAYGYKTPQIDLLAAQGVRFTHFLAAQPISGASRAGLLTGCYPNRIGFSGAPGPDSDYGIHPDEMTLGEVLKQKGYSTAIFGKWHLGSQRAFLPLQNGFDEYYGQYHIFHDWRNCSDFNDYVKLNLDLSHRLPAGKSVIGSFLTHDDSSSMIHGGENFCKLTTILQSTIPMCNPYFIDGFQTGDYYDYKYRDTENIETYTEKTLMNEHRYRLALFNLSRKPGGDCPDIERVMKGALKMRSENLDVLADRNSSFIELDKREDKYDQIITYARHNNGRTILVVANKNPNRNVTGIIEIPGLKETQKLENMVPEYGETSEFQVSENELRVNLAPADAYVFEIDTPNLENDRKEHAFKQKVHD